MEFDKEIGNILLLIAGVAAILALAAWNITGVTIIHKMMNGEVVFSHPPETVVK